MFTRSRTALLFLVVSTLCCWQTLRAQSIPDLLQVRVSWSESRADSPWNSRLQQSSMAAVAIKADTFVFFFPGPVEWIRSVRLVMEGSSEISVAYQNHDDILGLISVQIDKEALRLLRAGKIRPLALGQLQDLPSSLAQAVQIWDPGTGSFEGGTVSRPGLQKTTGWPLIPQWQLGSLKPIQPGSLVLYQGKVLGLVTTVAASPLTGQQPTQMLGVDWLKIYARLYANARPTELQRWPLRYRDSWHSRLLLPVFTSEPLHGPASRRYYGLNSASGAAIVTNVLQSRERSARLDRQDLILAVNNKTLLADGSLDHPLYGKLSLEQWLVLVLNAKAGLAPTDRISTFHLDVLRDRQRRQIRLAALHAEGQSMLVPGQLSMPAFFISGGLVFQELSRRYIRQQVGPPLWMLRQLMDNRLVEKTDRRRIVFINRILPLAVNQGYETKNAQVLSVDGVIVRDLQHLYQLVSECQRQGRDIVIGLAGGDRIVLDYKELNNAAVAVREQYGIPFLSQNLAE
ncbi:MAG: hypothetical protein KDK39_01845 [Leptospiraceae bacterium]|nr:hypothetical protein [Leptospiraceae bacterium]